MTPELYRRASDLFSEIRELPDAARSAALDSACAGDTELRAQVLRLLEADREAASGAFLQRHALEDAASFVDRDPVDLPSPGALIGNYRLGTRIGEGGMGVVFEAHDLHLDRRVAIKILPPSFTLEKKERVRRFRQEARAASLLNHPNMVSIFDADFGQGCCYIVMEFVEGKTLRELIASHGRQLDARTILEWIGQTAAALSAAHRANIVHRDIKPENIMVRDDGFVKVLDFGLAKLREPGNSSVSGTDLRTRPGSLAGTIQYLSPEQIAGEPAGPRSDLFSLGVVAYELATGIRPFDGPTDGAVFNAISNRQPAPPSLVRPELGTELDGVVMRLLEKDPELRFQTADDLRSACRRVSRDYIARESDEGHSNNGSQNVISRPADSRPPSGVHAASDVIAATGRRGRWRAAAAGLVCVIAAALFYWLTQPLAVPRVTHITQITQDGLPKEHFVADATRLYYAVPNGESGTSMFEVSSKGGDPVPMPLLKNMFPLDISADGSEMLLGHFNREVGGSFSVWVATTPGGPPRRIGEMAADGARWSPKGDQIVYCASPELWAASSDGSQPRVLATLKGYLRDPAWSPDGRTIRFTSEVGNVGVLWEVAADGSHLHSLLPEWGSTQRQHGNWTPDGKIFVFSAGQTARDIWAMTESTRFPFRHRSNLTRLTNGPLIADRPQPAPDGRRVFFRGRLVKGELVRYNRQSDQWTPYLQGLPAMQVDYSRDGKWITYASYPDGSVWRCASDGSNRVQLTTPPLFARNPRWSPDGTQIAFYGAAPGKPDRVYLVAADGGTVRQLTHSDAGPSGDADGNWSPDGASVVFNAEDSDQVANQPRGLPLAMIDVQTGRVSKLPGSEGLWSVRWSPDGRYMAAMKSPQSTLWLYKVATHQGKQLTTMSASWPSWSRDSQYVYFGNRKLWYRVRIHDGKLEQVGTQNNLEGTGVSLGWIGVTPDGSLISTREAGSTEIYALDWETP